MNWPRSRVSGARKPNARPRRRTPLTLTAGEVLHAIQPLPGMVAPFYAVLARAGTRVILSAIGLDGENSRLVITDRLYSVPAGAVQDHFERTLVQIKLQA